MKKRNIGILILIVILVLLLIVRLINKNNMYKESINDIKKKYDIVFNIKLPDGFYDDERISGNLKTEHTSNLIHSINQVYEKNYDFVLEKKDGYIYVYLDDLVSKIDINKYYNIFDLDKLDKCSVKDKKSSKVLDQDVNEYSYLCDGYVLSIYTSKILDKYIGSKIVYGDVSILLVDDRVIYDNGVLNLEYTNIKDDNYVLSAKFLGKEFKMFYTYNDFVKYSFIYDTSKFNIVMDEDIILSFNCDTRRYSNLKMTLTNKEIGSRDNYQEIDFEEMLLKVLSKEVYVLFGEDG